MTTGKIKNVVIIGAGLMGCGIAQKQSVTLDKTVQRHIATSTSVADSVKHADLIIEAIVENMKIKQELYACIESFAPRNAIIATNTSSLKLVDLSRYLIRKENFGGLHFFNPVTKMRLLEVISSIHTSANTLNTLTEFGQSLRKITVQCKDSPGFIANRILIPMIFEALKLVDNGIASSTDIDLACREGLGMPLGPFALIDFVGLDTANNIAKGWLEHYPNEFPINKSMILQKLVNAGKLGRKTGEGFYKYKSKL